MIGSNPSGKPISLLFASQPVKQPTTIEKGAGEKTVAEGNGLTSRFCNAAVFAPDGASMASTGGSTAVQHRDQDSLRISASGQRLHAKPKIGITSDAKAGVKSACGTDCGNGPTDFRTGRIPEAPQ